LSRSAVRKGSPDIRPFLANVLRGRRVSPERVEEVAHHYELFGGVSPITEVTRVQARGLEDRLAALGQPLPVYVGMRNWHPLLPDTLREMYGAGHRHAIGFIAAAQHSYSSCQQYRENVNAARDELRREGQDVAVTFGGSWFDHPLWVAANAAHVREALARLPESLRGEARLVFTAHSIPTPMAERSRYQEQLETSSKLVGERRWISKTGRSCIRAAAGDLAIRGSSRTSATTFAPRKRTVCAPWCSARSGSSAITSKCSMTSIARLPTSAGRSGWR
jgi:ferrochelatase